MFKDNNKSKRSIENSSPLYDTCTLSFSYINLRNGPPHRGQEVHLRPQTPQGESVANPETPPLIILGLVFKYDIKEVHGN